MLTVLFCHVFFLISDSHLFLILAAIAQIFNPIAELVTPIAITSKEEEEAEIEIHPVVV